MFAAVATAFAITSFLLAACWLRIHAFNPSERTRYVTAKTSARDTQSESKSGIHLESGGDHRSDPLETGDIDLYVLKQIYYQVQNLENFPNVAPQAREWICSLLNEATVLMRNSSNRPVVATLDTFSRIGLQSALVNHDQATARQWSEYLLRRRSNGPKELFRDRAEAQWWLKQMAPVKFVDGAWLGHINRVTLPYKISAIVRSVWQVFSEELGDGDRSKNHVHVYAKLLDSANSSLPSAYDLEFIDDRQGLTEIAVWKSAVAQLLICLFPHELFAEILGFNLHFEAASLETMIAARELKEVGLDPAYFLLHISIDNAHSGHAAIAAESVCRYIEHVQALEGAEAAHKVWERIQSGYMLSYAMSPTISSLPREEPLNCRRNIQTSLGNDVVKILQAKAPAGQIIHCGSRCKIGRRTLAEWLNPSVLQTRRARAELLWDLSHSSYWIQRGNGKSSRFLKEMLWGGRMFGCFTDGECTTIQRWIDALPPSEMVSRPADTESLILCSYPVFQPLPQEMAHTDSLISPASTQTYDTIECLEGLVAGHNVVPAKLLPLWLTHPCLLQNFVSVPSRAVSTANCAILKILRAQLGFQVERHCPAGMEEVQHPHNLSIVELGLVLTSAWGLPPPSSLEGVLATCPSTFAEKMLHWAMRPIAYRGYLIGMATAFAKLHGIVSQYEILSSENRAALREITRHEEEGLRVCWDELRADDTQFQECLQGYHVACREILKCFSPVPSTSGP